MFMGRLQSSRVTFADFANFVLPLTEQYSNLVIDRDSIYAAQNVNLNQFFRPDTRKLFGKLWHAFFTAERELEQIKTDLRGYDL